MIHQLRQKFILIAMGSVTAVILLMALSINLLNFYSVDSDLKNTLELIAGNQGTVPLFAEGFHKDGLMSDEGKKVIRPSDRFTEETPFSTRYFVLRYTDDGTLTFSDMRHIAAVTDADAEKYLSLALARGAGFSYIQGTYRLLVTQSASGENMAIFLDCQQERHSLQTFALVSVLATAVCIILVYILVLLLSKRAIDPMVKNAEKQKQFITDAGHELKTPLTVISTSLKVLEMEVGKQKWIDKIQAQVDKLTALVGELVTLSRMDEESPPLRPADFDVSAAVAETAESFRELAEKNGHPLELQIPDGLRLRGDEHAIRQLVSILLDNAVKYADGGAPISLSLKPAKKGVILESANPCAGIDPAQLDSLFDRFYRADKSRSRQDGSGSFGIGLSIARSIVEAHKGSIRAECPQPGVIRFTALLKQA